MASRLESVQPELGLVKGWGWQPAMLSCRLFAAQPDQMSGRAVRKVNYWGPASPNIWGDFGDVLVIQQVGAVLKRTSNHLQPLRFGFGLDQA